MIWYRIAESGADVASYHRIRTDVYLETGLITAGELDAATGLYVDQYDDHSIHLLASDDDGRDIGCWRMVVPEPGRPLPVTDLFDVEVGPNAFESSGSAIVAGYRRTLVGLGFYRAMLAVSDDHGYDDVYGIVERPYLESARAIGIPIDVVGEPRFVFNADNVPLVVRRNELMGVLHTVGQAVPQFVEFFLKPFDWTLPDAETVPGS